MMSRSQRCLNSSCLFPMPLALLMCVHFRSTSPCSLTTKGFGVPLEWCSTGTYLLTSKCWRWPCLSLLLLMLCSLSCSLLMNHVHHSLTALLISHSLPPSLFLLQSPLHQVSHELAKVPSLPFPSWIPSVPSSFFAFMELQALRHCVNQSKECFPFKSNSLPHHFATPHTSSWRAANSKHCPTTPICFILNGPI